MAQGYLNSRLRKSSMCVHRQSGRRSPEIIHPQIAEKLYQQGFLSYPRTETDKFDPQFNFMSLIEKQMADPAWGDFAREYVLFFALFVVYQLFMSQIVYIRAPSSNRETAKTMITHTLPFIPQRTPEIWRGTTSACMNTSLVGSSLVARRTLSGTKLGSKLSMAGKSFTQQVS